MHLLSEFTLIQHVYQIEKQTRQTAAPPAYRELIRRARSLPIVQELNHCLSQGVMEIDTNLVENIIRPTKLGMKNWRFFGSLETGTNNALIYTLLANCRVHDLDPEDYLVEVIERLPAEATPGGMDLWRLRLTAQIRESHRIIGLNLRSLV